MSIRLFAAIIVFIGSYLPLSVILLAQNLDEKSYCLSMSEECKWTLKQPMYSLGFLAFCFLGFILTIWILSAMKSNRTIEIMESKHIPVDLMNYVLPYVVSFMGIDYSDKGKFIGFIVFIVWMFVITYRSERIIMNPVLVVFGWKLYEIKCRMPGGNKIDTKVVLSKIGIDQGHQYDVTDIQDVIIIKKER